MGLAISSQSARSEAFSARDLDIFTVQPIYTGSAWQLPFKLKLDIVLGRTWKSTTAQAGSSNILQLGLSAEPKENAAWPTNALMQVAPSNERASLSPVMRFESKGERIEIKPRRSSISFVWCKAFQ
ncbi:MAG: hypothetical protein OEV23_04510 [Gallionella sp.]|nr:hypothetical protein [Gallionella sp.]